MMNILFGYAAIQLLSVGSYALVVDKINPMVKRKIKELGYIKNTNSLLEFNNKLGKIMKGFIPFYYAFKTLNYVIDKDFIEKEAIKEANSLNYTLKDTKEELNEDIEEKVVVDESVINENFKVNIRPQKQYNWNLPIKEKYVARKNDYRMFDNSEDVMDYLASEAEYNNEFSLTPFAGDSEIYKSDIIELKDVIEDTQDKTEEVVPEVTKKDIAHAIASLNAKELDELEQKIKYLSNLKKNKTLILDKDVA